MLAGENPAAAEMVDQRARISPRNVDAFLGVPVVSPDNSHPVSRILAGEADDLRHSLRPDVFQPNEADPRDRIPVVELRPKRCRQMPLHHGRLDPEVDEQPPPDDPVDLGKSHHLRSSV
jgi:hypothetical protein